MIRITELKLPLDHPEPALKAAVAKKLRVPADAIEQIHVFRRGYDARKTDAINLIYTVDVTIENEGVTLKKLGRDRHVSPSPDTSYKIVARAPDNLKKRPLVIGMGPCGLFAGFMLAEMGFRPIILERGKIVRERTVDTFRLWRERVLTPESNVQFGEGGAGTFSDGKLYTQVKDPQYRSRKVLTEFVKAGAPEEILYVSKPHIGTFRLVSMVENMRALMIERGADIRFQSKVESIEIDTSPDGSRRARGVTLANGEQIESDRIVMALGHSARDTFQMLFNLGVYVEPKPFSIGVRIEHPQSLIDAARFGRFAKHPILGAADYKLVHHCSNGRSVYSFCMCPGGTVVAAASEEGRLVTNGMSQYSRKERNANSGLVVSLTPDDFPGDVSENPLAGIAFQRHWEEKAYAAGGSTWRAPAQLVGDFLKNIPSTDLRTAEPSYRPGVTPTDLSLCLPDWAVDAIREALPIFGKKIKGYDMGDAVMTGVETRTSSPVRMTRRADHQSRSVDGLYPAGEGAGYAGGIYSAAIDGIRTAKAVAADISRRG
ncbi:MAG: NAD(P)/FAD-dependent oxidoreductase [Rhodobacteraceae bacterium]|nr:NAD(P)/FAD-dependent oxidoreductase [Paracoccaceae bacterium]